jgi:phosphohistidine phosphatase
MAGRRSSVVLLVRHGKAEDSHPLGDAGRALTDEGRETMRLHARRLASDVALEGILTSPLVRAVQTAEILAEAWGVGQVLVRAELDFGRASASSMETLCRSVGPGWALVGHNPSMAEALEHLLGHPAGVPRFRKGTVAALRPSATGEPPWQLAWLVSPGRKMSRELD